MKRSTQMRDSTHSGSNGVIMGANEKASKERVSILMVDDHPENLLALEAILSDLGENLVRAASGREALRALLREEFALILLDVQMPGMDGLETATLIRERASLQHTPIIFLTAMDKSEASLFRGYSAGAIDYIFKPFSASLLRAKVSAFIELYRTTNEVKRQTRMLAEKNDELARTNRTINQLFKDLETTNHELRNERDFVAAVIDTAATLVLVVDREGEIVRINKACRQAIGGGDNDILGRSLRELIGEQYDLGGMNTMIEQVAAGDYPHTCEAEWINTDGEPLSVIWSSTGLLGSDGSVEYVIVTGVDITHRRRAERAIQKMNEELEDRVVERTTQLEQANKDLRSENTERARAEAAYRSSESRFRRIFESNIIGINFSTLDGELTEANDAFLSLIDYTSTDLENGGMQLDNLTPPEYRKLDNLSIDKLQKNGFCAPYQKEYIRRDGLHIPVLVGRALLEEPDNLTVAFVLDLTDQKAVERELQEARDRAEAASRAKDEFLAVLSHELRTPLTPILTTVQVLAEDPQIPESMQMWIDIIRANVELEARLIDDLLDITRITQGKLTLNLTTVDIHALLTNVLSICQGDIQERDLNMDLQLDAAMPCVSADPARLQQVFWNLIKNAVKFTPHHGAICVRTWNEGEDLMVLIQDNGIGIDADVLPLIFDAFEQGSRTITRSFGGLGLGLSISRRIIDMHNGTITASSAGRDRGSSFTTVLRAIPAANTTEREPEPPVHAIVVQSGVRRILIVEDNRDTSRVMQLLLSRRGFEVMAAASVSEAIAAARSAPFDLVISDIGLPDGNGLELIRAIHQIQPVRAIAMSGYGMEADIQRSHEAGFSLHLTKPVSFDRLTEAIQQVMEQQ